MASKALVPVEPTGHKVWDGETIQMIPASTNMINVSINVSRLLDYIDKAIIEAMGIKTVGEALTVGQTHVGERNGPGHT